MDEKRKGSEEGIIDILLLIWSKRKLLFINCVIGAVLAVIIAFSTPKQYMATSVMAPEMVSGGMSLSSLGNLASMAGLNFSGQGAGNDAFYPELYPQIVSSTPFLSEILEMQVVSKDGEIDTTLYEYLRAHQATAWWTKIYSVPLSWFVDEEEIVPAGNGQGEHSGDYMLSKQQYKLHMALEKRIAVSVDKGNNMITIDVTMQDPKIAARVANAVSEKLQRYVEKYRSAKARKDLEYAEIFFKDSEAKYLEAQKAYAEYAEQHKNIVNAKYQIELDRLSQEKELVFNNYSQMAQNLEVARVRVQEQTPVCVVVQPAYAPIKAASPKKVMMLLLYVFIAFFGTVTWIVVQDKIVNR